MIRRLLAIRARLAAVGVLWRGSSFPLSLTETPMQKQFRTTGVLALSLAALSACQDAPTQPQREETAFPPVAVFVLTASPDEAANIGVILDDATSRLLPSLGAARDNPLAAALRAVNVALRDRDAAGLDAATLRARQAIAQLRAQEDSGAAAADLDAIGLALDHAEAALRHAAATPFNR